MISIQKRHSFRGWRLAAASVPIFLAPVALAAEHEHREHDAHAHGHGTLDIVVEGDQALIELRIPAVNVVGFEHAPRDDAEHEAVRRALEPLRDGGSLFMLSADADCAVEEAAADIVSLSDEHHHDEGDHEADEHAVHDDEHEAHEDEHAAHEDEHEAHDDEHEAHEDEGSETAAGEEEHSELRATYRFRCDAPEQLSQVDVRVFEHLHDVEEISARVVTPTAQSATDLHPGSTAVALAP